LHSSCATAAIAIFQPAYFLSDFQSISSVTRCRFRALRH
jgi:hypothetical protein